MNKEVWQNDSRKKNHTVRLLSDSKEAYLTDFPQANYIRLYEEYDVFNASTKRGHPEIACRPLPLVTTAPVIVEV